MDRDAGRVLQMHEQRLNTLSHAVQQASNKAVEAQRKEIRDATIEIQGKLFDRAAAYTNLILVGGYAGTFAIWSATRPQLPPKANIAVACALGFSLAAFVFFEVYKGIRIACNFLKGRNLLAKLDLSDDPLRDIKEYARREQKLSISFLPTWIGALVLAVGGALVAFGLLGYNFMAVLFEWPMWPK
jgi:hypothetical protein